MKPLVYFLFVAALGAGEVRYARLGEFRGQVDVQLGPADAWRAAERNLPLLEGSWLRTAADARLEVELDDGCAWRLGPDSLGEISDYTRLSTGQRITLLSVDQGRAYFSSRAAGSDSMILAVPGAQVSFQHAARIRIEVRTDSSQISVIEGTVRFSSPAAELDLAAGQTARVEPANPARFSLDRDTAPADQDAWSAERDKALANTSSALRVIESYGVQDLDSAGAWIQTDDLGPVWKPKVDAAWAPFQNGRWQWYGSLGFTWVSSDAWGWLPYHYGRWAHRDELGWLWSPGAGDVFKPGEVYWLRGAKFVGWGPLAPGEIYPPPQDAVPEQFLDAYTTYATFTAGAPVIDPTGFKARPKEPLKLAAFCAALPSPPLEASRLDFKRPPLDAGNTRVQPLLAGVAYDGASGDAPAQTVPSLESTPVDAPAPQIAGNAAQPSDDAGAVPVPFPLLVFIQRGTSKPRATASASAQAKSSTTSATTHAPAVATPPSTPAAPPPKPARPPVSTQPPRRWQPGEYGMFERASSDAANPEQQVVDVDAWVQRYPTSEHEADRIFLYVQAYNRMTPQSPAKLVESAAPLVGRDPHTWFGDDDAGPAQALTVLYLVAASAQRIPAPSQHQLRICQKAATELLAFLPEFFDQPTRPSSVNEQVWGKARAEMESAAREALALGSSPRR
jgi:hypothetical protein